MFCGNLWIVWKGPSLCHVMAAFCVLCKTFDLESFLRRNCTVSSHPVEVFQMNRPVLATLPGPLFSRGSQQRAAHSHGGWLKNHLAFKSRIIRGAIYVPEQHPNVAQTPPAPPPVPVPGDRLEGSSVPTVSAIGEDRSADSSEHSPPGGNGVDHAPPATVGPSAEATSTSEPAGGIPHRWKVVTMMAVAFVLCNMDKVEPSSNKRGVWKVGFPWSRTAGSCVGGECIFVQGQLPGCRGRDGITQVR